MSYEYRAARLEARFYSIIKNDNVIAKIAQISEVAQMAKQEVRYREYLLARWNLRSDEAIKRAIDSVELNRNAKQVAYAIRYVMAKWPQDVSRATQLVIDNVYRLGRLAAWKKASGKANGPLVYNLKSGGPRIIPLGVDVRKADEPKKPKISSRPEFDVKDINAISALVERNMFWIGEHYDEHLSELIAKTVSDTMLATGASSTRAGEAIRKALKDALYKVDYSGTPGTARDYFEGVAANAATVARAYGQIRSFAQIGVTTYVITNPLDERTCPVCSVMDGMTFTVREAADQIKREAEAASPEELKSIHPWLSTSAMQSLNAKPGAKGRNFAKAGLALPSYHFRCRCGIDVASESIDYDSLDPSDVF